MKHFPVASILVLMTFSLPAKDLPFLPDVELGERRENAEVKCQAVMVDAQCDYTDGVVSMIRLFNHDKSPFYDDNANHIIRAYTDAHNPGEPPQKIIISPLTQTAWLWPVHDQPGPSDTLALLSNGKLSISSLQTRMDMAKAGDKDSQTAVEALAPKFPVIGIGITRGEAEETLQNANSSGDSITCSRGGITTTCKIENGVVKSVSYHTDKAIGETERARLLSQISQGEAWAKTHLPQLAWRWPIHRNVEVGDYICTEGEHDLVLSVATKPMKADVGEESPAPAATH